VQDLTNLTDTFDSLVEAIRSDEPDDAVVGDVLLIVEVRHGEKARIRARPHTGARAHHIRGLLDEAEEKLTVKKTVALARRAVQQDRDDTGDASAG
jgi:hypothetical protein